MDSARAVAARTGRGLLVLLSDPWLHALAAGALILWLLGREPWRGFW